MPPAVISYQEHSDIITDNFKAYLDEETYIDLIFVCKNNRKVGAHQMVMGCLSKFLSNILIENQLEAKDKVIYVYLPDVRSKIMRYILQFIYTGKVMINKEELSEFNEDLILLGMPLSVITSVDKNQPNNVMQSTPVPTASNYVPTVCPPSASINQNNLNFPINIHSQTSLSNTDMPMVYSPNYNPNLMPTGQFLNSPAQLVPIQQPQNNPNMMYQQFNNNVSHLAGSSASNPVVLNSMPVSDMNVPSGIPPNLPVYSNVAGATLDPTIPINPQGIGTPENHSAPDLPIVATVNPEVNANGVNVTANANYSPNTVTVRQRKRSANVNNEVVKQSRTTTEQCINLAESDDDSDVITIS